MNPSAAPVWKPLMTRTEAEAHTKGSYYAGQVFYHGTDDASAEDLLKSGVNLARLSAESTYGQGLYKSSSLNAAREYAILKGGNPAILEMMLNVERPKVFQFGSDFFEAGESQGFASGNSNWPGDFINSLKEQGFDAIEIVNLKYVVVFSAK
jgi:hypothetical protein